MLQPTSRSYYIILFILIAFLLPFKGSSQNCEKLATTAQEALQLVIKAGTNLSQGNYEQAIAEARIGKAKCLDMGFWDGALVLNNFIYNCHLAALASDSANIYAERSLEMMREAPIPIGRLIHANVNYTASSVLIERGDYEAGLALLIEAGNLIKDTSKIDVNLEYFANCKEANFLNQSIKFQLNFLSNTMLAQIYNYTGTALIYLLQPDRAINYYLQADALFEKADMKSEQANVWINMGGALQVMFNKDIYSQTSKLFFDGDSVSIEQAEIYCFNRALRILEDVPGKSFLQGVASTNKATSYLLKQDYEKGLAAINDALAYLSKADASNVESALRAGISLEAYKLYVLAQKSLYLGKLNRKTECQAVIDTVAMLLEKNLPSNLESSILPWVGISTITSTACEAIGNWEQYEYFLEQAFRLVYPNKDLAVFTTKDARVYDINAYLASSIFLRYGRLLELSPKLDKLPEIQKLERVLHYHKLAILSYENRLNAFTSSGVRTLQQANNIANFNTAQQGIYPEAIRLTKQLYELTKESKYLDSIFQLMERSKAYIARKNINELERFKGVAESDLEKEKAYYEEIFALQKAMNAGVSGDDRLEKLGASEQLENELAQFLQYLQDKYPQYYAARYGNEVSTAQGVRTAILDSETAILNYMYVNDTSGYLNLLKVNQEETRIVNITPQGNMRQLIDQVHESVTDRSFASNDDIATTYSNAAYLLYDALIAPVEKDIAGLKRLIIIPDGELYRLDFNLLLSKKLEKLPKSDGLVDGFMFPYLLKKYAISYVTSASLLMERPLKQQDDKDRLDLEYGGFEPDYSNCSDNKWREMPFDDVSRIRSDLFPNQSNVWVDEKVSRNVFQSVVDQYSFSILHFSGHSFLHPTRPLDAYLALGCAKNGRDSITVADLFNMYINADLSILASCESGINSLFHPGEGFPSLAKGFEFAGCPSLIMSQWNVDTNVGKEIITGALEYIKKGEKYDVALWNAKLDYLESTDKDIEDFVPYYWAPMIAWGRMKSLD